MDQIKIVSINNSLRIISIFVLSLMCSCAVNDATGRSQFNFISEEEELKIGKDADKEIKRQYGVYQDPGLQNYVDQIGQRLVAVSGRNDIPYYFKVVDSPIINAFALPGGYIYVTRGILVNMNSESELAFVLGHEISHVAAKHGAQRLSQQRGIIAASVLADIVFKGGARKYEDWVSAGVGLAVLGYGRDNEFEADEFGVQYAFDASYHPGAYTDFFETLADQEERAPSWMEGLLASHPPTKERIELVKVDIQTLIDSESPDLSTFTYNKKVFLKNINGIVYGEGKSIGQLSKKGYYKNRFFGFEFQLEDDWDIRETSKMDTLLELEDLSSNVTLQVSAEYFPKRMILKSFSQKYNSKQHQIRQLTLKQHAVKMKQYIHKLPDVKAEDAYQVSTYIVHGQYGYRVIGYSKLEKRAELKQFVEELLGALVFTIGKSNRLNVYTVKKGDSLGSIAKKLLPNLENGAEEIRVFNKLKSDNIQIGQLLKIPISQKSSKD